jgi:hypothetical protein
LRRRRRGRRFVLWEQSGDEVRLDAAHREECGVETREIEIAPEARAFRFLHVADRIEADEVRRQLIV